MNTELILAVLVRVNLVASAAILLTLALRPIMNRALGARTVYRLWLLVPIATLCVFLPARQGPDHEAFSAVTPTAEFWFTTGADAALRTAGAASQSIVNAASAWMVTTGSSARSGMTVPSLILSGWLAMGMLLFSRALIRSRRSAASDTGPALIGAFRPKLILPSDFMVRFNARERMLVLAHETTHQAAGDPFVNALVELVRCLNWMNPLVHIAAFCLRTDQELACDAAVIERYPSDRRTYAEALLKTQIASACPPIGCAWPGRSSSSLRRRIQMLARRAPSRLGAMAGIAAIAAVSATSGYAAWASQSPASQAQAPQLAAGAPALPTVSAQRGAKPPPGLLTSLESRAHPNFAKAAKRGDIKVVFLGPGITCFWRYDWGGKDTWDRIYVPLKAANFGIDGATTKSVLWRLQNGELDGYKAKVFVVTALGVADSVNRGIAVPEINAGNAAIIAEIRKRQPQAKILLVAVPRGYVQPEAEAFVMKLEGEFAKLADDKSVFYLNLRDRFIGQDGIFAKGKGASLGPKGYAIWAQAMSPKLMELMN
ncbi:MAG TPA: M56 family metallopeptidase [Steroidobacteraceae bacterium]|nr:M56 family metallopeptidase [Steroidobacteraceae bacterium]